MRHSDDSSTGTILAEKKRKKKRSDRHRRRKGMTKSYPYLTEENIMGEMRVEVQVEADECGGEAVVEID
ncbi:MAG: hypothetical protein ACK56I_04445 [bacterium]